MIKVQMTYSLTTPESMEHGDHADHADHGFAEPGGWRYSIADAAFEERAARDGRQKALADMRPEPLVFDTVDDAIEFLVVHGTLEPSCSSPCGNGHCWLTESEGTTDYTTGETVTLSFHLECDADTHAEIVKHFSR